MDTGTHLLFGLGIGGLAMADSDVRLRLTNKANYIKNHRGLTHSLPAVLLWTAVITFGLSLLFRGTPPWPHLAFWVLLSVAVHVYTDLFNSYGTQALWPFSKRRVRWNIIHIFNPFIFSLHLLAVFLRAADAAPPKVVFPRTIRYIGRLLWPRLFGSGSLSMRNRSTAFLGL